MVGEESDDDDVLHGDDDGWQQRQVCATVPSWEVWEQMVEEWEKG